MPGHYIVLHSAVLGPPHTERTFQAGELVSEEDFRDCPEQWERLERLKAIRPALPQEHGDAMEKRERNMRAHLGLPPDASVAEAKDILRLRREHSQEALAESKRRIAALQQPAQSAPASPKVNAQGIPSTPVGYPSEEPTVPPGVSPAVQGEAAREQAEAEPEGEEEDRTGHRRRRRGHEE